MSERQAPYSVVDPAKLTPAQVEQLRYVLSILSLPRLVHLAHHVKAICKLPGFGRITITVRNHHVSMIQASEIKSYASQLDDDTLRGLME